MDHVEDVSPHDPSQLGDIAVWLAARQWAVYPQVPGGNTPTANCARCKAGDCPGVRGGCECLTGTNPCHALHAASSDIALTRARWRQAPRCNPALHLGRSGLVVLDIDCHGGPVPEQLAPDLANPGVANGVGAFAALLDHLGQPWPEDTLTVESPTGGLHVYYQAPRVALRHCQAAWQVEVKAGASSITAPGSVRSLAHGGTGTYRRVSSSIRPAPFPRWLGDWLVHIGQVPDPTRSARPPAMPTRADSGEHSQRWWQRAWSDQLAEIAEAEAGTRNDVVLRRGLRLFNLAGQPGCPWTAADAERALIEAQQQYAARTGRPASQGEYRAVAQATRQRASTGRSAA